MNGAMEITSRDTEQRLPMRKRRSTAAKRAEYRSSPLRSRSCGGDEIMLWGPKACGSPNTDLLATCSTPPNRHSRFYEDSPERASLQTQSTKTRYKNVRRRRLFEMSQKVTVCIVRQRHVSYSTVYSLGLTTDVRCYRFVFACGVVFLISRSTFEWDFQNRPLGKGPFVGEKKMMIIYVK